MKTLIASLIIAVSFAMSSNSFAQNPSGATYAPAVTADTKFYVQTLNTGRIDVTVVKPEGTKLTIAILDDQGHTLTSTLLTKKDLLSRTRFDLNMLPDGTYHIVLQEGANRQVKDLIINTQVSDTVRTIEMS